MYRSIQVLFVLTSCGPLAPPFTRAEKNLAFACFRPIIRKNPLREAEIDTSAFLQAGFHQKLQICNLGHKNPMRKYSAAHGDFSHVIRLLRQGARITRLIIFLLGKRSLHSKKDPESPVRTYRCFRVSHKNGNCLLLSGDRGRHLPVHLLGRRVH